MSGTAVRHAALLALLLIVLVLEADRLTAVVAEIGRTALKVPQLYTAPRPGERIDLDLGRAQFLQLAAQMLEALEVAALALPVADLVLDKFELRRLAKIRDRKDR